MRFPLLPVFAASSFLAALSGQSQEIAAIAGCDSVPMRVDGATAPSCLRPFDSFRDCESCPKMVVLPPGGFIMGSPVSEERRSDDEGPEHAVKIARGFAAGAYEITRGEFAAFAAADPDYRPDWCWVLTKEAG